MMDVYIHETADVSPAASIGEGTKIWHQAQVREGARVGRNCILGKSVYVDRGVIVGDNVKIQNYACVYRGSVIDDGVFIGPHVLLLNDTNPRAINTNGTLKSDVDWEMNGVVVKTGASIGAGSVILPEVTIGRWAMVGAGSVVTRDVSDQALVYGNPARQHGFVCRCGQVLEADSVGEGANLVCESCKE